MCNKNIQCWTCEFYKKAVRSRENQSGIYTIDERAKCLKDILTPNKFYPMKKRKCNHYKKKNGGVNCEIKSKEKRTKERRS